MNSDWKVRKLSHENNTGELFSIWQPRPRDWFEVEMTGFMGSWDWIIVDE